MEKITIKTWFLYSFGILLLVVVLYSFNAKLNGIDTQIEIHNNSRSSFFKQDKFKYIDIRIIVNDETVFNESLPDGMHEQRFLDVTLNYGYNRIEVYSDSSKQYGIRSEYVFFKNPYLVNISRAVDGISRGDEYYNLSIDRK
jgi:hypothetical protein